MYIRRSPKSGQVYEGYWSLYVYAVPVLPGKKKRSEANQARTHKMLVIKESRERGAEICKRYKWKKS